MTTRAVWSKATRPTRTPAGTTSMNRCAASWAATMRLGVTSVASIEIEVSNARTTVGSFATSVASAGRAAATTSRAVAVR